jgi:hypothetical protein
VEHNDLVEAILNIDGWGKIEGNINEKKRLLQMEKQLEKAQIFFKTFSTEHGKLALKELINMFLVSSVANPRDDMVTIGIREGNARVVKFLLQQIEIAKKG